MHFFQNKLVLLPPKFVIMLKEGKKILLSDREKTKV